MVHRALAISNTPFVALVSSCSSDDTSIMAQLPMGSQTSPQHTCRFIRGNQKQALVGVAAPRWITPFDCERAWLNSSAISARVPLGRVCAFPRVGAGPDFSKQSSSIVVNFDPLQLGETSPPFCVRRWTDSGNGPTIR